MGQGHPGQEPLLAPERDFRSWQRTLEEAPWKNLHLGSHGCFDPLYVLRSRQTCPPVVPEQEQQDKVGNESQVMDLRPCCPSGASTPSLPWCLSWGLAPTSHLNVVIGWWDAASHEQAMKLGTPYIRVHRHQGQNAPVDGSRFQLRLLISDALR